MILPFCYSSPLHLCIASLNVAVVKRWAEITSPKDISEAIDIPSSAGTALCLAAALKKDRETGKSDCHGLLLTNTLLISYAVEPSIKFYLESSSFF